MGAQAPPCYLLRVSPTVFTDGEAKFWLTPVLALASHSGLSARELRRMQDIVEVHHEEIVSAWRKHFGRR